MSSHWQAYFILFKLNRSESFNLIEIWVGDLVERKHCHSSLESNGRRCLRTCRFLKCQSRYSSNSRCLPCLIYIKQMRKGKTQGQLIELAVGWAPKQWRNVYIRLWSICLQQMWEIQKVMDGSEVFNRWKAKATCWLQQRYGTAAMVKPIDGCGIILQTWFYCVSLKGKTVQFVWIK